MVYPVIYIEGSPRYFIQFADYTREAFRLAIPSIFQEILRVLIILYMFFFK